MRVLYDRRGISLPDHGLALDPIEPAALAVLSHGHGDHVRAAHGRVVATRTTAEIYRRRIAGSARSDIVELEYGEPLRLPDGATIVLEPAGHILGSAQVLVIAPDGERLVYTGDVKLKPAIAAEAARPIPCDHLILESTFGKPGFRTLDRDGARRAILAAAERAFADGAVPVFAGYPLGRGQELVHTLVSAGHEVAADASIARYLDLYAGAGYATRVAPLSGAPGRGVAVVTPLHDARGLARRLGRRGQLVFVSGWAADPALAWQRGAAAATALIAYSDHADHGELCAYVEAARPARTDVVHGYARELSTDLRGRGFAAAPAAWSRTRRGRAHPEQFSLFP